MITRIIMGLICTCSLLSAQIDYYSPENIKKFADYLFENQEYEAAVNEYQRLSYVMRQSMISDSLLLRIGLCYQLDHSYHDATTYYQRIVQYYPESVLTDKALYRISWLYYLQEQYEKSNEFINMHRDRIKSESARKKIHILQGMNHLQQFQWQPAQTIFAPYAREDDSKVISLNQIALEGSQLSYKSPVVAGVLSTLIPGSGKVYVGRKMDGIYAFLLISILGYQTFRTFDEQGMQSVKGWLYGSVTAVLYVGNIYGSVVAAKIYNHKLRADHITKMEISLSW